MKILIMGLPTSGKTWFAERLQNEIGCAWYNADAVRTMANDWDFSVEGRNRQALRMKTFADFENNNDRIVACDFVCPTPETRLLFKPDLIIWINTIDKSKYQDTNKVFIKPNDSEGFKLIEITKKVILEDIIELANKHITTS